LKSRFLPATNGSHNQRGHYEVSIGWPLKRWNAEAIRPLQTAAVGSGGLRQCPFRTMPRPMAFRNDAGFSFLVLFSFGFLPRPKGL